MGLTKEIAGLQAKELLASQKRMKTDVAKSKVNDVLVRYISSDFRNFIPTVGTLYRDTDINYVLIENPDTLGIIMLDNCILYNKLDGKEWLDVIEGYPYSINYTEEFNAKMGVLRDKHPEVKTWLMPMNINNIPKGKYEIIMKKVNGEEKKIAFTQKFIYQLGNVKLFESMFKPKSDGILIGIVIGALAGIIIGAALFAYLAT